MSPTHTGLSTETYVCKKCGCSHDGEPMRAWMAKRGKDTTKIKFCVTCFWGVLCNLSDEEAE